MATRDRLKKIAVKNPEMWPLYTKQRNRVTEEIRNSIQDHYKALINESNGEPKNMWKTINRVLNKDVKLTNLSAIEREGKTLTKEYDMLEALNHHFVLVGPDLAKHIKSNSDDDCLKHIIPESRERLFQTVYEEYVLNAINRLEKGKASGPDKGTITLVKDATISIAYPLMMIYNASLMNGIFPDVWKLARVTPIYKSGPKTDANYYRLISVISLFSRMLERLTRDQLFEFLKTNKRLTSNQAAFCKHYSTMTSLIGSTDYWYESIDHSKVNLTVFLDLKKASDTVDHSVLMKKFCTYGVRDKPGDWFEYYLTNRKQFCSLNGLCSKARKVTCGIPQGSGLGPLLFIIYLNDLEKCLQSSRASIHADDTSLTITSSDPVKLVDDAQHELLNISEWMRVNRLSPNPKKTESTVIGHSLKTKNLKIPKTLTLDGSDIKKIDQAKSLCIITDENLTWDEQYKSVKAKMSAGLSALKRLKNILPQSQLCSVYYALVESHLRYGDVIWGSLYKTKLTALQRLQSRAWSVIENAKIKDHWSSSWLIVENIIRYDWNVMTYKIVNR